MTLQELRYLVALADRRHFVSAATACHVGQPTLSMQLKKLEDYLGVKLFERDRHHVRPTPIGMEIVERARIALGEVEQIRELARQARDPMDGPLRLGVIPTLGPYLIPYLLPALSVAFPKLRLVLHEEPRAGLIEGLRQYRYDVLMLALPAPDGQDMTSRALFREAFVVALPSGHPLACRSHIGRDELAGQNLLVLEEGHCMREQVLAVLGLPLDECRDERRASSLESLRQMVAAGVGCTLLPALAVQPGVGSSADGSVQVRPFAPPVPARTIGMVWRRGHSRWSTVRTLAEFVQARLPAAVEPIPLEGAVTGHGEAARAPGGSGLRVP